MLLWALVGLPVVAGAVLLVAGHAADRVAAVAGVATAGVTLVLAAVAAAVHPSGSVPLLAEIRAGLAVDALSAALVVAVGVVLVAVLVVAAGELGADEARARFHGLMLVFAGAMLVTVTATGLAPLLVAWEVMGACSYALIGFWWREERRARSGAVALLTTRAADLGLYLAAGAALAGGVGGLELARLAGASGAWRDVVAVGVVAAALGKSAQLPFSFWLSRAMDGPSPTSALLHSATMVAAGAYLLLRLRPLLAATGWAGPLVAWVGAATALALGAVALAQSDLKQVLAASTCSQLGFMVLAAGAGETVGGTGQLLAHAATKSLLFLGAGAWLAALGTRDLVALRGVAWRYPVVGVCFTVGALTLAGLPPLSLWVTKDAVLAAALRASAGLYVVGLAAVAVSAAYAGRMLLAIWLPAGSGTPAGYDTERAGARRVDRLQWWPLPVLAGLAALLGAAGPGAGYAAGRAGEVVWWQLVVSGLVAVAGVLAGLRWRPAVARALSGRLALPGWLGLQAAARRVVVAPVLVVANALARFDDRVVDGGVRTAAATGAAVSRLANLRVEVRVDGVVRAVAAGTRAAGRWARRPQTGQLHHYYAQAAVGLLALAVLLVALT